MGNECCFALSLIAELADRTSSSQVLAALLLTSMYPAIVAEWPCCRIVHRIGRNPYSRYNSSEL